MTKKVLISLDELQDIICECVDYNEGGESWSIDKQKMRSLFNAQPEAPQWVSVEDGLPDNSNPVIIFIVEKHFGNSGNISVWQSFKIGRYSEKEKNWAIQDYGPQGDINTVTHWMPIPPLPEVEK